VIIAGMRPQEYADALREARARRAAEAEQRGSEATDRKANLVSADTVPDAEDSGDQPTSAVDIAPRPPSD
jgi:hypothetical protein